MIVILSPKCNFAFIEDPNKDVSHAYYWTYINIAKIAKFPDTAIVGAIQQGDYKLVNTLLTALNIDPNKVAYTLEGEAGSLLYFACNSNQKEIARLLLEKGATPNFNNSEDFWKTPLCIAVYKGHPDIVALLLENKANPNYGKEEDMSYLGLATFEKEDIAMVTELLAHGANMEFISNGKTIFAGLVYSCMSKYADNKDIDMVKVFVQYGANPDLLAPHSTGQMFRDREGIYEPLKVLLKLESAFRKKDYKEIEKDLSSLSIETIHLSEFIQWKLEISCTIRDTLEEHADNLLELGTFASKTLHAFNDMLEVAGNAETHNDSI